MTPNLFLDRLAERTARELLRRYAPDYLDCPGLQDAITHLARLALDAHARLYQALLKQPPAPETAMPRREP